MTTCTISTLPPRFVRIKIVPQPDGSTKKIPIDDAGRPIDPHNSITWRPRELCGPTCGFVLTGDGYFMLDMDHCGDGAGVWSPQAMAILAMFPAAAREVSTSGRGLHVMGRCDPAAMADRRNKWGGWLECYTSGRVVTFGPGGWAGDPESDCTAALLQLVPQRPAGPDLAATAGQSPATDEQVLERMLKAAGAGARFGGGATPADLWHARADVLTQSYPSSTPGQAYDASTADAALMAHLAFWTHRDPLQMDRLFRQSGLMRPKYEEREDYRSSTISGAISVTRNVADWTTAAERAAPPKPGSPQAIVRGYLTASDQAEHFAGCVYVTSLHRVLTPIGRLLKPEQFNAQYGGHEFAMQADGAKPTKRAFECFTESRAVRFPKAYSVTVRGDCEFGTIADDAVNIYRRPASPRPGDVTPFLAHMAQILPVASDRASLLQWLACVAQRPGKPIRWAPVLVGPQGNGKSFIAQCAARAIGKDFCHVVQPREISATHNGWIHGKLFALVEEIDTRERRDMIETLKPFITDPQINVRAMNTDSVTINNVLNWFFCTNHEGGVPKVAGDRRFAIFHTASHVPNDDYFRRLYGWAEAGGFEHVAHYLSTLDIGQIPERAPDTSTTVQAMHESFGNAELAVLDAIEESRPGTLGGWLSGTAVRMAIEDATGKRPGPRMIAGVLKNLGYREIMRASRTIIHEAGKPRLYAKDNRAPILENYLAAQGYADSSVPLHVVRQ